MRNLGSIDAERCFALDLNEKHALTQPFPVESAWQVEEFHMV